MKLFREFIKYAGLNILGMVSIALYIFADTFFVAKALGSDGLAALNFSISVFPFISAVSLMLGIGGSSIYVINLSRGNIEKANRAFTSAIRMGMIFAFIIAFIGGAFSRQIASGLGASGHILEMAAIYIKYMMIFAPAYSLNHIVHSFVRSDNSPRLAMIAMVVSSISNVVLDYVFMFIFHWGIFGAVIATCLAPLISLAILVFHAFNQERQLSYIRSYKKYYDRSIISMGFPTFVTDLASAISLIVFNYVTLGLAGNIGVASYAVIANLAMVVTCIYTGLGRGVQPLSGREYALGNRKNLNKLISYALISSLVVTICIYTFSYLKAEYIVGFFNEEGNKDITLLAARGIRIYFIGFFFAGVNIGITELLVSMEESRSAFIVSLLRGVVLIIPSVIFLSSKFGIDGTWASYPVTEFLSFLLAGYLIYRRERKIKR